MHFEVLVFPDEPIILARVHRGFDVRNERAALFAALRVAFDAAQEPFIYITVNESFEIDLNDVVAIMVEVLKGPDSLLTHPMLAGPYILVTTSSLVRTGAHAIAHQNPRIQVYDAASEYLALHLAREMINGRRRGSGT